MAATEPAEMRASNEQPDWTTLAARAIDDVARMVQAEIHLAEASFRASLKESIDDAFTMLAAAGLLAAAGICVLTAAILLLHHWLEWWLALAITGCVSAIIGVTVAFIARRPKKGLSELA
jgi:hypothetical protein